MRNHRLLWVLGVAVTTLSARAASAAVFTCAGGDANCLRDAVYRANATPEADTIQLYPGTYTLNSWLTCISTSVGCDALGPVQGTLTVIGAGRDATILQPDPSFPPMRIFDVPSGAFLTVCNLTIRGVHSHGNPWDPSYGGLGVLNAGRLMLTEVAIRDNSQDGGPGAGAGIRNDPTGVLYMSNSVVSGNESSSIGGAGILNDGSLTIVSSLITGNSTPVVGGVGGAGLFNRGSATIQNSTVGGNSASSAAGGGIYSSGALTIESSSITGNTGSGFADEPVGGGGIFVAAGSASVNNSTIQQNRASGLGTWGAGIRVAAGGSLVLNGSTVADNRSFGLGGERGGGIYADGTVQIRNSIVARNTADDGAPPSHGPDCWGTLVSLGHNILGDPTDCVWTPLASDRMGDAGIGTFTDDGTPGHGYVPLLSTSVAIDAADPATSSAVDQLGRSIVDGNLDGAVVRDIGATEFKTPVVNALVVLNTSRQAYNPTPVPNGPFGTLTVAATLTNVGVEAIYAPYLVLKGAKAAVLLSADQPPGGPGSKQSVNAGTDGVLTPGERISVTIVFGLQISGKTAFAFDVLGGAGATTP